ncbi:hypothetical protein Zmor_009653 [Zophobas morio]|uniref:Protein TsetseEP domain-containing protein n=1 Tax=Zophobas morio TaxID=2755281 RepID=A0AA38MIT5_9CUCU|nr:hypothetical protein Zmor_009653 [Zophobas morio]
MNVRIVVTLFIASVFQGTRAETINEAIATLTPQIVTAKTNIDAIVQNGRNLIIQTRRTIGQNIAEAETTIQEQLDQLDDIIEQAGREAEEKGVDVSKCVSDVSVALSDLGVKKFETCGAHENLHSIGGEFGNLRKIKGDLSRSVGLCRSTNLHDVDNFKNCLQTSIDEAETKSDAVKQKITNVCTEAAKAASKCVVKVVGELDTTISTAAHDLKQCLLQIL